MANHFSRLALSPFSLSPALEDCMGAIRLCCTYARDAAQDGRFAAAHGLFQSALIFFERAQQLLAREGEFSFHESHLDEAQWHPFLVARAELDDCARHVYPDGVGVVPYARQEART